MVTWAAACFMLCHFILLKKTDFALGKCTLFVLMINARSLKILLLFQQLMQETLKAPLLFSPPQAIFCMHFNDKCTVFIFWKLFSMFSVSVARKFTHQISIEILLQN